MESFAIIYQVVIKVMIDLIQVRQYKSGSISTIVKFSAIMVSTKEPDFFLVKERKIRYLLFLM
jgi:hypothetical protein